MGLNCASVLLASPLCPGSPRFSSVLLRPFLGSPRFCSVLVSFSSVLLGSPRFSVVLAVFVELIFIFSSKIA